MQPYVAVLWVLIMAFWCLIIGDILLDRRAQNRRRIRAQVELEEQFLATQGQMTARQIKAKELARHIFGPKAFEQVQARGYVEVPSQFYPGWKYRITRPPHGVVLLDNHKNQRAFICINADAELPSDDQFVTLYLIAKYDEERLNAVGKFAWEQVLHAYR